jgi:predicted SAM-dependent methyltransferase
MINTLIARIKSVVGRTKVYNNWARKRDIKLLELARKKVMIDYSVEKVYLNIGAGRFVKDNWRLLDYSEYPSDVIFPSELIDFNINLTQIEDWPIKSDSIDLVYTSHCLEHLGDTVSVKVIEESYRILKQKGGIRITLPDIDLAYQSYVSGDYRFFLELNNQIDKSTIETRFLDYFSPFNADEVSLDEFILDSKKLDKITFLNKYIPKEVDWSTHNFAKHATWFDFEKLKNILENAGFKEVVKLKRNESRFAEFSDLAFDSTYPIMSLYIEAIK